jgi:hypothetical protein
MGDVLCMVLVLNTQNWLAIMYSNSTCTANEGLPLTRRKRGERIEDWERVLSPVVGKSVYKKEESLRFVFERLPLSCVLLLLACTLAPSLVQGITHHSLAPLQWGG